MQAICHKHLDRFFLSASDDNLKTTEAASVVLSMLIDHVRRKEGGTVADRWVADISQRLLEDGRL